MRAGLGVLGLRGIVEAEEFVELEAFRRRWEQFFENGGGFGVVVGFVLAYGLLEEAIEIGIRGISRDLSLRPRRRGRCEQEDQREYGRHNPRASAEAEEKMERAKYLRWVARWGAPCCAPTQSRWGSCCRRRVVLNLGSHGHEIDFSIRTALAKRAENRWRWLLAHRQDEKKRGERFWRCPAFFGVVGASVIQL